MRIHNHPARVHNAISFRYVAHKWVVMNSPLEVEMLAQIQIQERLADGEHYRLANTPPACPVGVGHAWSLAGCACLSRQWSRAASAPRPQHPTSESANGDQASTGRVMNQIGMQYAVILSDPQLREGVIREATRSRRSAQANRRGRRLRLVGPHVAHAPPSTSPGRSPSTSSRACCCCGAVSRTA